MKQEPTVTFIVVHPGSVATDMRPDLKLPGAVTHLSAEESSASILQHVVFSPNIRELNGRFISWDGKELPW